MKKQLMSMLTALGLCVSMLPVAPVSAGTVLTRDATGIEDGYNYELWNQWDKGSTIMELTGNGSFTCSWNGIENCLFRTGKKFDCTQTYKEIGNISIDYEVDYKPDGNSYLCVYGWTRDPLVEYYIVESWGTWRPPGGTGFLGTTVVDGATYDVYKTDRINQPSIDGDTTFVQYWSVRQEKRTSGTINVAAHFAAWEEMGLKMGKLYEAALNVEGYQSNGSANVKKNVVTVGGDIPDPTPIEPPTQPEPGADGYFFHSTFEGDKDEWTSRGDAATALTADAAADGSQSLFVSGRTDTWNGTARSLSTTTFMPGSSYSFSVMAMQNATAGEDFKLTLQYTDASGEEQYDTVAEGSGGKGKWVQLANTNYQIPSGAKNLLLYVETADSMTDFFIDEAIGAPKGTKVDPSTGPGTTTPSGPSADVNGDGTLNVLDVVALQKFLLGINVKIDGTAADLNSDGVLDVIDLVLLKRAVLNPSKPVTPNTPNNNTPEQSQPQPPADTPQRVEGVWYNTADVSWIDPSKPMVAICFDDGPVGGNNYGTRIQDALTNNGFHATFFYWGISLNGQTESEIKRAHDLGFEIANHTKSHKDLTTLSADGIREEIYDNAKELTRITGETDFLLRPPYLAVNSTLQQVAGTPLINCGVDSQDWNGASAQQIINTITSKMADGSLRNQVVLMHETYDTTAQAMEYLAPYMKEQGWQIVTVSEMFKANGKDMKNGEVYNFVR